MNPTLILYMFAGMVTGAGIFFAVEGKKDPGVAPKPDPQPTPKPAPAAKKAPAKKKADSLDE